MKGTRTELSFSVCGCGFVSVPQDLAFRRSFFLAGHLSLYGGKGSVLAFSFPE